jgi:mRNA interferase RelE/StbE
MPDYAIVLARSARKELEALDPPMIERVIARIEALAHDPRPTGARKLRSSGNLWRVRVGDYRIVHGLDDLNCIYRCPADPRGASAASVYASSEHGSDT